MFIQNYKGGHRSWVMRSFTAFTTNKIFNTERFTFALNKHFIYSIFSGACLGCVVIMGSHKLISIGVLPDYVTWSEGRPYLKHISKAPLQRHPRSLC